MHTLSHKILLRPTRGQEDYFGRAAGTARKVYNWALDEWTKQTAAGLKPTGRGLKKLFNRTKYEEFPWMREIHRDAHSRPFDNVQAAWNAYFRELKKGTFRPRAGQRPDPDRGKPSFKKKGRCTESFYVANDKMKVEGDTVRLPKVGKVKMAEQLRFEGKILGATVSKTADRWFIAIQVEVDGQTFSVQRAGNSVVGVDLGVSAAATLSDGRKFLSPKPLAKYLRRLRIRQRRVSRKMESAKTAMGLDPKKPLPKGTRLERSQNWKDAAMRVAKTHMRVTDIRKDFTHKLTTRLCRENQAVAIEDLCVRGMARNHRVARAISDIGFGRIREQLAYKTQRYGTRLVVADRFFPSSKTCSACGFVLKDLPLSVRSWVCPDCGAKHDRDMNAARNLKGLIRPVATFATLPLAKAVGDGRDANGMIPTAEGKVTPARHDCG